MSDVKNKNTKTVENNPSMAAEVEKNPSMVAETTKNVAAAFTTSATAYVNGLGAVSKALFSIGQEVTKEAMDHGKASLSAKNVRSLAEMQVAYAQHRFESSTVHAKEITNVVTENVKNVYTPFMSLVDMKKAS